MKKILVKGPVSAFIPGYDDMMQSIRVIGSRHMPTVERPLPLTEHNYEFEQQAAEAGSDALPGALETFHSDKPIQGTWVSPPSLQSLAFPDLQGSTTQPVNLVGILDEQPHWSAGPKQRRLAHEGFTYGGHKRDLFRNIPLPKGTQQGALQYGALGALLERGIDPLTLGHKGGYASLSGHRIPTEEEVKRYLRTFTDTQKVRDALLRTGMPAEGGIEMWGMPKVKDMADLKRISSAYPNVFGLNERTLRSLPMDDAWSELLKGQDFHPSVQGYLENPEGAESFRMDPENPGQELPIPSQVAVQQPLENNFEGSFDESFWSNHAHDRVTDSGRIASEREKDEVQQRITDALRPYLNEYGYYKKDSPQSFAIRTHILDSHRDSATHGKNIRGDSNGDSIVGIVHPDRQDSRKPKLTTVYLRRSELAPLHGKSPQLFRVNKTGGAGKGIRVDKVINNHNLSKREFKMRLKQAKLLGGKRASEPMDLSWRMLKAQQTIDAYSQENIKEGFDPETQNVIIASKPGAKNISAEEQSRLHDEMLRRISELEGTENMRIMSARGRSEEWGDENAFMLSNVPDDVMPKIHSLAEEFGQESILHSPKGMAGTQFVDSEGEVTGGLEEGEFTRRKPANFTEFPTGQKYAYGDYVAASEPMPIGDVLVKYDFYHDKKRSGVQGVHYPPSRLDFTPIKGRKNEWGTSENAPALQESGKNKRIDPNIAILNPHPSMQEGQAFDQTAQWLGRNLLHEGVHSLIHDEVSEAATTPQQYTNMTEWGAHQAMFPGGQDQADLANRLYASHPHTTNVVKSDVLVKMPQEARNYATQIHEGQMYGEQPYMTHVEDVASRFDDPHLQRIAYLHDVVEDSETGIDEIHERFGEDIGHAVDALTRRKDEQYFDYINRVKEHPEATQVKLADLHSNLKNNPNESLARRYEKAIQMLKHDILVKERVSPEAKRHKLEYDTAYEASPERRKYRADLNRERRRRGMYGDHSGRDISHTEGGKLTVEGAHENRARHFKDQGTLRHVAIEKAIPPEILLGGAGVGMTMAKLARLVAVMQAKEKAKNNERMQNLVGVAPSATPPDMAVDEPHDS